MRSNWTNWAIEAWRPHWTGITVLAGLARKARCACLIKIFVKTMPFLTKIDFLRQYLCSLVGQQVHFCQGSQLLRGGRLFLGCHCTLEPQRVQWVQRGREHSSVCRGCRLCQELQNSQEHQVHLDNACCYITILFQAVYRALSHTFSTGVAGVTRCSGFALRSYRSDRSNWAGTAWDAWSSVFAVVTRCPRGAGNLGWNSVAWWSSFSLGSNGSRAARITVFAG